MKKAEALALFPGKYAILHTVSWGSYLCGPLTVVTNGRRIWRLSGPIVRCVNIPWDGKPPMEEGRLLEVGNSNVGSDVFDSIPTSFGASYNEYLLHLLNQMASTILSEYEDCKKVLTEAQNDPTSMEIIQTSFRNIRGTRMRLIVQRLNERIRHMYLRERDYKGTLESLRRKDRIPPEPMALEVKLEETADARSKWVEELSSVDLGPSERV